MTAKTGVLKRLVRSAIALPTRTGTTAALKAKHLGLDADAQMKIMSKQGRPVFGVEMKVVDDAGQAQPHDGKSMGELLVRGPWIVSGYFEDAEATAAAVDKDGWFHTGDVVTIDTDGYMQIVDRRKELNFATAGLSRLILWRRPPNYLWDPRLEAVIRDFVAQWQDPVTGFFGAIYLIDGRRVRTVDLSLTFHMARYLEGRIGYWPELIDTLLAIRDERYPYGWLDENGLSNHNNYDVAVLFQLGWPQMRPDQRRRAAEDLGRLTDWCLNTAIAPDGAIRARAPSESLPESYYFAIAFLDTVGYFEPARRFWTQRPFPEAPAVRERLARQLLTLPQSYPMVRMARERLSGSR